MANDNPVFRRFNQDLNNGEYASIGGQQPQYGQYNQASQQPQYGQQLPGYGQQMPNLEQMYSQPAASSVQMGRMTLDDVFTKSLVLFGTCVVFAAIGWFAARSNQGTGTALWLGGMLVGLVIGLVISFKRIISVPLFLAYAVCEGLFVGAFSQFCNQQWPGVVVQAVLATFCVFVAMFIGWKAGFIKVTARSRKIFGMALVGYMLFSLLNLVLVLTHVQSGWGIGGNGSLGIIISVIAVGLASYSLAIDFDSIDNGVRAGLPQKYSWLMAHGLLVTVIWLYIELLRLFARMRSN